jgi:hypothetical protein
MVAVVAILSLIVFAPPIELISSIHKLKVDLCAIPDKVAVFVKLDGVVKSTLCSSDVIGTVLAIRTPLRLLSPTLSR